MTADRVRFAVDTGGLVLPQAGAVALFGAPGQTPLNWIAPERCEIIQGFAPDHAAWAARGLTTRTEPGGPYSAAIITLPRARDLAEARLAEAESVCPDGLLVVDGAKTDGIEAIAKALKSRVALQGQISKAHGKCLWFSATGALADWRRPAMSVNAEGDMTAPGVFSADGADPASKALADALPKALRGHWADLGAGWGWLSRAVLADRPGIVTLDCIEADKAAQECARVNVTDTRARFHWADATTWRATTALDGVVMNPPFHAGRRADPALGRAFICAAARLLEPQGQLWMVANRHLPYENTLHDQFREVSEIAGTSKFKILCAARPKAANRRA